MYSRISRAHNVSSTSPGIEKGIAFAIQCFTQKGDKVIIQPPVYHPFRIVPEKMKRELIGDNQNIVLGANLGQSDQGFLFPDDPARIVRVADSWHRARRSISPVS